MCVHVISAFKGLWNSCGSRREWKCSKNHTITRKRKKELCETGIFNCFAYTCTYAM